MIVGNLGAYVARALDESGLKYQPVREVELSESPWRNMWEELGLPIPSWRARVTFMNETAVLIPLSVFSRGWLACKMVDWWIRTKKREHRQDLAEAARKAKWEYRSDVES